MNITKAAQDVLAERARQINAEGWTMEHDDEHEFGQLAAAAAAYASEASDRMGAMMPRAANDIPPHGWPWAEEWWKPSPDLRRDLVKAAALLLAEIERLDRRSRREDAACETCHAAPLPSHDYCPDCRDEWPLE